ncbi:MAG: amidohydrolase [Pirellulales bacterium]|nr:amidohydrolase [Pirellulales bacterium]
MRYFVRLLILALVLVPALSAQAGDVKDTDVYARMKKQLDAIPGIDTHSHLRGPEHLAQFVAQQFQPEKPLGCPLWWIWRRSYFTGGHGLAPWPKDGRFETWWAAVQTDFNNSRARSAYRVMLPIFKDLYGVDFESLTLEQAKELNDRMRKDFDRADWADEVIRKRANTEIMVIDSYWKPWEIRDHYPFTVSTCNVTWWVNGYHASEFGSGGQGPYAFAAKHNLPVESLDDYIAVLDRILVEAKKGGTVCLKSAIAYQRTLKFDRAPKHRAEEAFGKPRKELNPARIKAFQDYVFWRVTELAAKHDFPFQIHTGHAYIQGSNPMNLVDLIQANPKTKFILFHGGFPWVGETGMIALRCPNVWVDSVWMPTLSYTMGKRAYKEWLDMFSSNRIMWGTDMATIEGTYGAAVFTRQCITEALAEKVVAKELREEDALRIGRQILRENALEIFPSLRKMVAKDKTTAGKPEL